MPARKRPTVDDAAAAQTAGPPPALRPGHMWSTQQEYDAQVALPCHLVDPTIHTATLEEAREWEVDAGHSYRDTLCHLRLGSETLRTTDVVQDVTCAKCKRRATVVATASRKRGAKR